MPKNLIRSGLAITLLVVVLALVVSSAGAASLSGASTAAAAPSEVEPTECDLPGAPTLISPANGSTIDPYYPTATWTAVEGADSYTLQLDESPAFTGGMQATSDTNSYQVPGELNDGLHLYWRVRATNTCGDGPWSEPFDFYTPAAGDPTPTSTNTPSVDPTFTSTPTSTHTPADTPTSTATSTATQTSQYTPTATSTDAPGTATPTATVTSTPDGTPTVTPTLDPNASMDLDPLVDQSDPQCAGWTQRYTISFINDGTVDLTNVYVRAKLPEDTNFDADGSSPGLLVDGPLDAHWLISSVSPAQQIQLTLYIRVWTNWVAGSVLETCVTVSSDQLEQEQTCAQSEIAACATPTPTATATPTITPSPTATRTAIPARVRIGHLAPFGPDPYTAVSIYVDGVPVLTNMHFADSTTYMPMPAEVDHLVEVYSAGSAVPAISAILNLRAGTDNTAIAIGGANGWPIEVMLMEDNNAPPSAGNAKVQVGNLSPFAAAAGETLVDVRLQDGTLMIDDLPYGFITGHLLQPAWLYDLKITSADGARTLIDPLEVTIGNGVIVSVFAVGDGSNQPLGVFAWPSDQPGYLLPLASIGSRTVHLPLIYR